MELRRRMMGKNEDDIPYQKIEYLESGSGQYINTNLKSTDVDEYYIKFQSVWSSYRAIFGNYAGEAISVVRLIFTNTNNGVMYSNVGSKASSPNSRSGYISNDWNQAWGRTYNGTMYFKLNSGEEGSRSFEAGTNNATNIALFGQSVTGAKHGSKIARMQFKKNGSLVRDFIPVRIGTTGYMYDKVSKQLFGNAGTGNFILGPDIN